VKAGIYICLYPEILSKFRKIENSKSVFEFM